MRHVAGDVESRLASTVTARGESKDAGEGRTLQNTNCPSQIFTRRSMHAEWRPTYPTEAAPDVSFGNRGHRVKLAPAPDSTTTFTSPPQQRPRLPSLAQRARANGTIRTPPVRRQRLPPVSSSIPFGLNKSRPSRRKTTTLVLRELGEPQSPNTCTLIFYSTRILYSTRIHPSLNSAVSAHENSARMALRMRPNARIRAV
ncbi:hypothetical protein B0H16DRAFT_56857 [Mycena metata]|uniref:Uncharacterized protein n=1 Tax=Mycena metata TaxID=1033252 RepID=A0AAD7N0K9_9AGAR|nr:hypothetical protein B0H16DRAFT_56857 [Mycena metata]